MRSWPEPAARFLRAAALAAAATFAVSAALLGVPARADDAQEWQAAKDELHRQGIAIAPGSRLYESFFRSPVDGDIAALRLARARVNLLILPDSPEAEALHRHESRLLTEAMLGRPATRIADARAVIAHEAGESWALAQEAFRRFVTVKLPQQPSTLREFNGSPLAPEVKVELTQAAAGGALLSGVFTLTVALPNRDPWARGCRIPLPEHAGWTAAADNTWRTTILCNIHHHDEKLDGFALAQAALRAGQASLEVAPGEMRANPAQPQPLPYREAAQAVKAAHCSDRGMCPNPVVEIFKGRPGWAVAAYVAFVAIVAGALAFAARREPAQPVGGWGCAALAYLLVATIGHAVMIGMAFGSSGLVFVLGWAMAGLPLFGPAFFLGLGTALYALGNRALAGARTLLGTACATLPVFEYLMLDMMKK